MVGVSCCIASCRRYRCKTKYPQLSFFSVTRKRNPEWTANLIKIINRCDSSFKPKNAKICSVHFKPECIFIGKLAFVQLRFFTEGYVMRLLKYLSHQNMRKPSKVLIKPHTTPVSVLHKFVSNLLLIYDDLLKFCRVSVLVSYPTVLILKFHYIQRQKVKYN